MSTSIPDLWPEDLQVAMATPLAILRAQAGLLRQKTKGILYAETTTTTAEDQVLHQFDLVAPALGPYRKTVLSAKHLADQSYPVVIRAQSFVGGRGFPVKLAITDPLSDLGSDERRANSQDEFLKIVREVLHSGPVRAMMESLIARSNEAQAEPGDNAPSPDDPS